MPAKERYRHQAVIVGGGLTGLALALMLQMHNIDYVLLESYGTVTPDVGASIGLFPNGLRILDQLGLYEELLLQSMPVEKTVIRDGVSGRRITTRPLKEVLAQRHGYPAMFTQRHQLLCLLHRHVQEKDRVHVNRKVTRVDTLDNSAVVYCHDGSVFEGQIVIGADGVRSTIRKEMWRNADANNDGATIPARDRAPVPCEFACVFGTAKATPGLAPGETVNASANGVMAGLMSGHGGDVFLFSFWTMPEPQRRYALDNIPRFGDEDMRRELGRSSDFIVADNGMRLRDVIKSLDSSGVTALPHYVMRRWHYGRIIIIGDSAHKYNPFAGQGGNSCLESCAALVNALQDQGFEGGNQAWELSKLSKAFASVETERVNRLVTMVEQAQDAIRISSCGTWKSRLFTKYILPLLPLSIAMKTTSEQISGGVCLNAFPRPSVTHDWPYADDPPTQQQRKPMRATIMVTTLPIVAFMAFLLSKTFGE
ncbi:uncharacterized protein PG998_014236 [Apiospora kogelbergensis]|uniref:uncharacterized protein n=1 Tax=Apiospora kogelbergensis TaxID=1337665 RepID=UPI003130A739